MWRNAHWGIGGKKQWGPGFLGLWVLGKGREWGCRDWVYGGRKYLGWKDHGGGQYFEVECEEGFFLGIIRGVREKRLSSSIRQLSVGLSKIIIHVEDHIGTALLCQKDMDVVIEGVESLALKRDSVAIGGEEFCEAGGKRRIKLAGFMEFGKAEMMGLECCGGLGPVCPEFHIG